MELDLELGPLVREPREERPERRRVRPGQKRQQGASVGGDPFHHPQRDLGVDGEGCCRYLVASSRQMPEVAEYPELGQIAAQAPTASQTGERLRLIYDVPRNAGS